MSEGYQQERTELCGKNELLQAELDAFNEDSTRADKFIEIVHQYTNFETLSQGHPFGLPPTAAKALGRARHATLPLAESA